MKDVNTVSESAPVKKKAKLLEFKPPSASVPAAPSISSVAPIKSIPYQLKNRLVSQEQTDEYLRDVEVLQLSSVAEKARLVRRLWRTKSDFDVNFVVVGIVCHVWKGKIPAASTSAAPSSTASSAPLPPAATSTSLPVASQTGIQATKTTVEEASEKEIVIVRLTDLQRTSVSLSIQPKLQDKLSLKFGSVVLILNPSFMAALDGEGTLLTIEKETQVCVIGPSSEIGLCSYRQPVKRVDPYKTSLRETAKALAVRRGDEGAVVTKELVPRVEVGDGASAKPAAVCPNFINATRAEYCEYHMFELVKQTKSQRMVLNDAGGGALGSTAMKKEFSSAAKHISDGLFSLYDRKWRVSERGVTLATHVDNHANGPSSSQMCVFCLRRPAFAPLPAGPVDRALPCRSAFALAPRRPHFFFFSQPHTCAVKP